MLENQTQSQSVQSSNASADSRREARHRRVQKVIKYLSLSGTGIGVPGTISLLVSGQVKAAVISGVLTISVTLLAIAYKFVSSVTNRVLDLIEEELEALEDPLAQWIVSKLKTSVVSLWWKLNSQFQRQYAQTLVDTFRELKIEGFRIGLPVLDLEDVFVSLQVATKIPENTTGSMIQRDSSAESQEIWDFLAQSAQKKFHAYRRLAVIGPPGSGKTTLMRHLTLTYAKQQHREFRAPKFIPVLLYLRDIRHQIVSNQPHGLPQLIRDHIENLPAPEPLKPPPNWVEDQLKIGKLLVMLDGLDEVAAASEREQVSQWVNRQMKRYRQALFILTSRPHGYRTAPVACIGAVLEVLPFTPRQMQQFVRSWYLQTEIMSRAGRDTPAVRSEAKNHADDLSARIMENRSIADMAQNPLLVTMIATVHHCGSALPGRRVELYQKIFDLLLGPRQEAKKIKTPLTAEQNKQVLQVLALALMEGRTREFTPAQGQELIATELIKVAGDRLTPAQFLKQIQEISGLLVERELGAYELAHLSFQEYLAAAQVNKLQQDELLTKNFQDPWWAETIRLYAAQSDATPLLRAALSSPSVESLVLAYDCLEESLSVAPGAREELETMLEQGLDSTDLKISRLAAEVKLSRRLKNLVKISETVEIDLSYITNAEYQLFLDDQFSESARFQTGSGKQPVIDVNLQHALEFCNWLSSWALAKANNNDSETLDYFRLPVAAEIQTHPIKENEELGCWMLGAVRTQNNSIRVIRGKIPSQYTRLAQYLNAGEWEKADKETELVMLQMANRKRKGSLTIASVETLPCDCLCTIDQLWLQFSQGCFGLGMQTRIFEAVGGKPLSRSLPSLYRVNSSEDAGAMFTALAQQFTSCGIERFFPFFTFPVVTLNSQGQEINREHRLARYFAENLGNDITMDMVAIPGGSFFMGSPENESDRSDEEGPQHKVTVPSFFMSRYPITQDQWRAVAALPKVNRKLDTDSSGFKGPDRPVERVNWFEAVEFCDRLSQYTGRQYCLPSEAEWEYACRAGTTTPFHFGKTITADLANYYGRGTFGSGPEGSYREETTSVENFDTANAFGLYDMHGNVWEWCLDDWHKNYKGAPSNGSAWLARKKNDNDSLKLLGGGSWDVDPQYCRSAFRRYFRAGVRADVIGFRVVCAAART